MQVKGRLPDQVATVATVIGGLVGVGILGYLGLACHRSIELSAPGTYRLIAALFLHSRHYGAYDLPVQLHIRLLLSPMLLNRARHEEIIDSVMCEIAHG